MFKVHLITVGSLKEKYLKEAQAEYIKRIGRFASVTVTELPEASLPASPSEKEIARALEKEGELILKKLRPNEVKIALCVEGETPSSEAFSAICAGAEHGAGALSFVIGSSYGLSPAVKAACDRRLSFSKMTFPHQLMRVILLEQLYRAFKIDRGESYHK